MIVSDRAGCVYVLVRWEQAHRNGRRMSDQRLAKPKERHFAELISLGLSGPAWRLGASA
jgi:hypothetical protein